LQEEWNRHKSRNSANITANFAHQNIRGGPQCQQWQGQNNSYQNNNQNSYSPQAGPSNSGYKPAPYKKEFVPNKPTFALNPRYQYPDGPQKVGPNWQRNQQNRDNK
jgi:hypothetical protein